MRSLVLRAGTVAGVVAVLALPVTATAASATTTAAVVSSSAAISSSAAATHGRIVNGEALAAALVVAVPSEVAAPPVHRRPLGTGSPGDARVVALAS